MSKFAFVSGLLLIAASSAFAKPRSTEVSITFDTRDFSFPVRLYRVKRGFEDAVARTRVVKSLADAPLNGELRSPLPVPPDTEVPFALVLKNDSTDTLYFFAVPHVASPPEASAGIYFECLCNHRIFAVPPGMTWYRIVRLQSDKLFGAKKLELKHSMVRVKEQEALTVYRKKLYEYGTD